MRDESVAGKPVIALTARSRKEDRERCLRAGMDECLTKPFTAADLSAAMDRVLRTYPPRQPPRLDLIDPPVLLAACGGDPTMLRKMCRSLQSRVPEHLAAIREALRDQDAPRLREAAHKFYGLDLWLECRLHLNIRKRLNDAGCLGFAFVIESCS